MRKSEMLVGMRVRRVNLSDNTIDLSGRATKNGEPRLLVMTAEVRALVAACIQGKHGEDFLFTRQNGQAVRDIRDAWSTMFKDAGIEPRLLHDLRRSAARNMIRAGVDRDTVKKIGGWRTDSVFSRYNIQDVSDLAAAAKKIEDRAAAARRRTKYETDKKTDNLYSATLGMEQALQ